jgi:hypothetical protein
LIDHYRSVIIDTSLAASTTIDDYDTTKAWGRCVWGRLRSLECGGSRIIEGIEGGKAIRARARGRE